MAIHYHTLAVPDGMQGFASADRIFFGVISVLVPAGSGAGAVSTAAVTFAEPLPTGFMMFPAQTADDTAFITAPTNLGFTLNVEPRLAANTVGAQTIKVLIVA